MTNCPKCGTEMSRDLIYRRDGTVEEKLECFLCFREAANRQVQLEYLGLYQPYSERFTYE